MPKKPSLDRLNSDLERSIKLLDRCAGLIRDLALSPRRNIGRIGQALSNITDIQFEVYEQRPDLRPQFPREQLTRRPAARSCSPA